MIKTVSLLLAIFVAILLLSGMIIDDSFLFGLTYISLFFLIFSFYNNLGKKFLFIDFLCLIPVIQWLLGITIAKQLGLEPPSGFHETYAYLFAGTIFYIFGLVYPFGWGKIKTGNQKDILVLQNLKAKVNADLPRLRIEFWGGLLALLLTDIAPTSVRFILQILGSYFFVATIKWIFVIRSEKWVYLLIALGFNLQMTLFQGMLGTIVFWCIALFLLFGPLIKVNLLKAVPLLLLPVYLILVLYSAKVVYRAETWKIRNNAMGKEGSREIKSSPGRLSQLITERLFDPGLIFSRESSLNMVQRINQAFQVALVMNRVPSTEPFANGEMTLTRPIAALIPRVFWPDKPLLPDPNDYKRFTGIQLTKYNSVTIGPIGEAYADFGKAGVVFLFFYGLFIRVLYKFFREHSIKNPYYIIWFLLIMTGAISHTETTIAGSFNGYIKLMLFVYFVFKIQIVNYQKLKLTV